MVRHVVSLPQTNYDEEYQREYQELDYLCNHFNPLEFMLRPTLLETGCSLRCELYTVNGEFIDGSTERIHHINEGRACDERKVRIL